MYNIPCDCSGSGLNIWPRITLQTGFANGPRAGRSRRHQEIFGGIRGSLFNYNSKQYPNNRQDTRAGAPSKTLSLEGRSCHYFLEEKIPYILPSHRNFTSESVVKIRRSPYMKGGYNYARFQKTTHGQHPKRPKIHRPQNPRRQSRRRPRPPLPNPHPKTGKKTHINYEKQTHFLILACPAFISGHKKRPEIRVSRTSPCYLAMEIIFWLPAPANPP